MSLAYSANDPALWAKEVQRPSRSFLRQYNLHAILFGASLFSVAVVHFSLINIEHIDHLIKVVIQVPSWPYPSPDNPQPTTPPAAPAPQVETPAQSQPSAPASAEADKDIPKTPTHHSGSKPHVAKTAQTERPSTQQGDLFAVLHEMATPKADKPPCNSTKLHSSSSRQAGECTSPFPDITTYSGGSAY
jgi:hypothetical protein